MPLNALFNGCFLTFILDISLYCVNRLVTNYVLYFAGVFGGGSFINAYFHQKLCNYPMSVVNFFGFRFTLFGKGNITATVNGDVFGIFK